MFTYGLIYFDLL